MDASKSDFKTPGSGTYSRSYNPGAGGVVQHGGGGNKNVNKGANNNQNVSNIKKKKVSKAPRGVRAAMRGFKTMKIGGKVGKRTKGTGGGWV